MPPPPVPARCLPPQPAKLPPVPIFAKAQTNRDRAEIPSPVISTKVARLTGHSPDISMGDAELAPTISISTSPQSSPPCPQPSIPGSQTGAGRSTLPPLGMRRIHPFGSTTRQSGDLPTKQKGFRSPLTRPQAPSLEGSNVHSLSVPYSASAAQPSRQYPATTSVGSSSNATTNRAVNHDEEMPLSSPSPDADSSFGDIDLPMDLSAIEEEMRKYES